MPKILSDVRGASLKGRNIIPISTVEFRYYDVIITLANLGKPEAIRDYVS